MKYSETEWKIYFEFRIPHSAGKHIKRSINLIDLAGSEKIDDSTQQNETICINNSLNELKNVLMALHEQQSHVPYRNSSLTRFLMPSLQNKSKILMFVNVSPLVINIKESKRSLRFAEITNKCELKKKLNWTKIKSLRSTQKNRQNYFSRCAWTSWSKNKCSIHLNKTNILI